VGRYLALGDGFLLQKKAIETENSDFFAPGIWTWLGPFERTKEDNNITTQQSKGGGERVGGWENG